MKSNIFQGKSWGLLVILGFILILGACANNTDTTESMNESDTGAEVSTEDTGTESGETSDSGSEEAATEELVEVKQVTNWFAQAEHGGQHAAQMKGLYEEAGLDMTIESGGPQVSGTQQVAAGTVDFGMGQGVDMLIAREKGIPLVAVAGIFQKTPQAMLFHANQSIEDFEDLDGRKVFVASGIGFWEFIKNKYELNEVEQMNYTGSLSGFIEDETAVTQSYLTSEPYTLEQEGIETDYLPISDSGFSPYANILYTTESYIEENPEIVKAYVEASIKGWNYYEDNYEEINPFIQEANPDMTLDKANYSAQALQPLVYGGEAESNGVGYMTEERWNTLMEQMVDLGLLKSEIDVAPMFTNEYLPE